MRMMTKAACRAAMIPAGAVRYETPAEIDAEFYAFERAGVPYSIGWIGTAGKPTFHYRHKDEAQRAATLAREVHSAKLTMECRAKMKASRKNTGTLEVGQVLYSSWGYDQTNIDFYEVKAVSGSMVTLQKLAAEVEETGFMSGNTKPILGQYAGEPIRRKLQGYDGKPHVKIESYASAWPWDGRPKGCSWYA